MRKKKKRKIGRPAISENECKRVSFVVPIGLFEKFKTIGLLSGKGYGHYIRKACEQYLKEEN
jgi:hypothetical protein